MDTQKQPKQNFFSRNWKIILVIAIILIALIVFIGLGSKKAVSPDIAYFPT